MPNATNASQCDVPESLCADQHPLKCAPPRPAPARDLRQPPRDEQKCRRAFACPSHATDRLPSDRARERAAILDLRPDRPSRHKKAFDPATIFSSSGFCLARTVSTTASVSRKSYPRNFVGSALSSPSSTLISSFFCALRARARCSSISFSKPTTSTVNPRSRAISSVRSSGKPYVSYSSKSELAGDRWIRDLVQKFVARAQIASLIALTHALSSSHCRNTIDVPTGAAQCGIRMPDIDSGSFASLLKTHFERTASSALLQDR